MIQIQERNTPKSVAMKYIANRIGLNVRPDCATFDDSSKTWEVSLKALVPSEVQLPNNIFKIFVYNFENLGKVSVRSDSDGRLKILEKPKALDIETYLVEKFADLTSKIEKEILAAGSKLWGEFTYTRMWLRPFYTMIVKALTRHNLMTDSIAPEHDRYVNMLISADYLQYEEYNKKSVLVPSNMLNAIAQKVYSTQNEYAVFEVAKIAVSSLFASHYNDIRNKLKIFVPSAYVDTTKAYYMDAVRVGESISMTEEELWLKYRIIGNRHDISDGSFSFPTVISEIVAGNLLKLDQNENLTAQEEIFEKVLPFRDELAEISLEM